MTQNKLISLAEAVRRYTWDGMQYASGAALPIGSDAIAFGREVLRQNRRDLHAIFHCSSQQLNLLAGAGLVSKAECGFTALEVFGFANGLRRAVESGQMALEDYSNLAMPLRYLGGALNWPFVPATTNMGSDIQYRSAFAPDQYPSKTKIPTVTDPFSGREIGAFSPLQPDLAAIHVTLADIRGNSIMLGTEWSRFELSRAAKTVVIIADFVTSYGDLDSYLDVIGRDRLAELAKTETPFLLRSDHAGIATLTLNRPQARNALSQGMLEALRQALAEVAADASVRVVILAGAGPAFCAGHDLKEIRAADYQRSYTEALFALCAQVMQAIVALPKPVIARVHGVATAAGCQLVASCDLAVAAEDARFATPGVNIGLFCSTPMVALSRNVGHKAAMQMLLTGDLIDAPTALRFGLVNEIVPAGDLEERTGALAAKLASKSPLTLAVGKEAFYRQAELPLADAYFHAAQVMVDNLQAADAQEGIGAFMDKRPPVWRGC